MRENGKLLKRKGKRMEKRVDEGHKESAKGKGRGEIKEKGQGILKRGRLGT
jgi:hypothetical protein